LSIEIPYVAKGRIWIVEVDVPVSLADVAQAAGVSLATASRVLSGSLYPVSDEMRQRVVETASRLGYTPNALARALVTKSSHIIGAIIGSITDLYFSEICRGIEDIARARDYLTIVCSADRHLSVELAYLKMLCEYKCAGVIFAGGMFTHEPEKKTLCRAVKESFEQGMPIVSIGDRRFEDIPSITVDHIGEMHDLTHYLVDLGHTRIAYVDGPTDFSTSQMRLQGYLEAMQEAGLQPLTYPGKFDYHDGRASALKILNDGLPEAIIAFNDDSAVGILRVLQQAGVRVPKDVSVAGVDNIRYAEVLDLTTVEEPMYELGAMAAQNLLNWQENSPPAQLVLPYRLVPRGTTARRK
jgi:LacI family transcriptional regulator